MAATHTPAPTANVAPTQTEATDTPTGPAADLRRIGRINRRLVMLLAAVLVAVGVAALTLPLEGDTSRADAASTARWNEASAQYEAIRQTRSNHAWTAQLEAAAAHHDAIREARAHRADAARLTQQALQLGRG